MALVAVTAIVFAGCGSSSDTETTVAAGPPAEGTIFGYNEAITPGDAAGDGLIAASGASFVRVALNWAVVEPEQGERNWAPYDAIDKELAAHDLRPLWVMTSAPCWAAGADCGAEAQTPNLAPDPEHLDAFATLAAEAAERYPSAVGLEIWNEPNIPNFWRPAPDADLYRQLLSKSAEAVHATDSEVPVVAAGPSPVTEQQVADDPAKIGFVPFIEQVMAQPDAPDVDAIGLHPYSLLQRDADPVDESIRLYDEGRDAAGSVAPELPIWVTEVGLTTAGQYAITPQQQADGLERIVAAIADDGVPVISIHRFFDQLDPPLKFEQGFGVVAADRSTPKPSFCSAADAIGAECSP